MQRRALVKLLSIEARLLLREPVAMFFTLVLPTGMLLLFGSIFGNQPTPMFGGYGSVDVFVPAFTAMVLAGSGVQGLAGYVAGYREQRIFRRLKATPLEPHTILAAQVLVMLASAVAGTVLLVVTGAIVFDLRFGGNPLLCLAGFVVSSGSMLAVGFVLGGALPSARAAQAVTSAIFFPLIFLSGATIPLEVLPKGVRAFSTWLPFTHVVKLLRGLWIGAAPTGLAVHLAIVVATGAVAVLICSRTFRWEA